MSTEMPSTVSPSKHDAGRCAQYVGDMIRSARYFHGQPIEEVAPLVGLTVEEWRGIEAGDVSYAWEQMLLICNILRCGPVWMSYLRKFYKAATQQ